MARRNQYIINRNSLKENKLRELNLDKAKEVFSIIKENKSKLEIIKSLDVENQYISDYSQINEDFIRYYNDFKIYYIPTLRTAHSLFQITKLGLEKPLDVPATNDYEKIEKDIFLHTYFKIIK